jgi:anti-sigma-K factor RskA
MNDDFEKLLARQRLRPIPPEWRAEILRAARTDSRDEATASETAASWWRALFWPSPIAWISVACAWVVIIGMNIAARPERDKASAAAPLPATDASFALLIQERDTLDEISQAQPEPAAPPQKQTPPGACIDRRSNAAAA